MFYECINNTDGPVCLPKDEIYLRLNALYIIIGWVDYKIDHNNVSFFGQPYSFSTTIEMVNINNKFLSVLYRFVEY